MLNILELAYSALTYVVPNIENPFKKKNRRSYKPRFEFTLNKIYLWKLTQVGPAAIVLSPRCIYTRTPLYCCAVRTRRLSGL